MHGHVKTVELLLARAGTDVNATFLSIPSGETALDYAGHHVQLCSQIMQPNKHLQTWPSSNYEAS